jgi:hypothetical protein
VHFLMAIIVLGFVVYLFHSVFPTAFAAKK